jgi:hypothetical protein
MLLVSVAALAIRQAASNGATPAMAMLVRALAGCRCQGESAAARRGRRHAILAQTADCDRTRLQ